MKQTTHNTVADPDKASTGSSKKNKQKKLTDYKWTVIRKEPHNYCRWYSERHYTLLSNAENELRKWNSIFGRDRDDFELISYQEYIDRKAKGMYNE